jgi:hypothetical protein
MTITVRIDPPVMPTGQAHHLIKVTIEGESAPFLGPIQVKPFAGLMPRLRTINAVIREKYPAAEIVCEAEYVQFPINFIHSLGWL